MKCFPVRWGQTQGLGRGFFYGHTSTKKIAWLWEKGFCLSELLRKIAIASVTSPYFVVPQRRNIESSILYKPDHSLSRHNSNLLYFFF